MKKQRDFLGAEGLPVQLGNSSTENFEKLPTKIILASSWAEPLSALFQGRTPVGAFQVTFSEDISADGGTSELEV